jgi:hypothetical protein
MNVDHSGILQLQDGKASVGVRYGLKVWVWTNALGGNCRLKVVEVRIWMT